MKVWLWIIKLIIWYNKFDLWILHQVDVWYNEIIKNMSNNHLRYNESVVVDYQADNMV